ncbi:hypothetical protein TNCV_131451 [Trichonephila clavipes]|nr:hypothetical protein TNCV_131451 [Trichonephila clavipes]
MVLKANDRRTSCPCHNEFRGPRSDYVRQVALATQQQIIMEVSGHALFPPKPLSRQDGRGATSGGSC